MPIYDYVCECGQHFESWRRVSERKESRCVCGKSARMRISPVNFYLDPVSGDFPTRTDTWEKSHVKANEDDLKSLGLRESKFSGVL